MSCCHCSATEHHVALPQQHPRANQTPVSPPNPTPHLPKPCCLQKHWVAWEGEFPAGQGRILFLPRKGLEKSLPSQGWPSRSTPTSVVGPPLVGTTQQDTEHQHHPPPVETPLKGQSSFSIVIMIIIIISTLSQRTCSVDVVGPLHPQPSTSLWRSCRNGDGMAKFFGREDNLAGKKYKKLYPRPDFVGRTYLSSILECLPSANLSKADKTPYYKSKLLKLG